MKTDVVSLVTGLSLGALALAGVGFGALEGLKGDELPYDSKEPYTILEQSKVDTLPDGGLVWYLVGKVADGGIQIRTLPQADYVRYKPDAGSCRQVLSDGGILALRPWVRFPADASTGLGCDRVASSVLGIPGRPDLEDERELVKQLPKEVGDVRGK